MPEEHLIVPYSASPPPGGNVIVLAPHPDDETLGMGGTIARLVESGSRVRTIFLTGGGAAEGLNAALEDEYIIIRRKEALRALKVLGAPEAKFLPWPDRGLLNVYDEAIEGLEGLLRDFSGGVLYSPSPLEYHPDHRAASLMAVELQRRLAGLRVVFYEVTTPLRPSLLVDVTGRYGKKRKAVKKYRSQLRVRDYLGFITALNRFRALTVEGAGYAEAFWEHDPEGRPLALWPLYEAF